MRPTSIGRVSTSRSPLAFRAVRILGSGSNSCERRCWLFNAAKTTTVESVVVGAGPGGIAAVGNLLDSLPGKLPQLWVDPHFAGGRVGAKYREVPSNTKVALFLQFADAVAPFRQILEKTPDPNAATVLQKLAQDKGCELGHAADLCLMLTEGIREHYPSQVEQHRGEVEKAVLDEQTNTWTVSLDDGRVFTTDRLVLCTGSSPITSPLPILKQLSDSNPGTALTPLHLDTALKPSLLSQTIDPSSPATVGVVGASHSAILVLMNLYKMISSGSHPNLRVKWFTRHNSLRYAEQKDGWILYDNTGLKGDAAQWARDSLEHEVFEKSPVSKVVTRFLTGGENGAEESIYKAELPGCTHVVQAIGYKRNTLPRLMVKERSEFTPRHLTIEHDALTGRFRQIDHSGEKGKVFVPNLFGAGIAFPEVVTDPAGNVESAVGFWKFMRFLKRVVPEWVSKP
ncbi:unnamed protein product [Clonostachys byssicola]|uniref:FAD-dependent urate hydroxylase HpyO/Asp monooxygenase CreE-like FAD/NAD(P)-binding domain-containing protein n=1 Tax=Clonostachys byssicola TaxID=160290 RepID=A0A9N9UV28_9HYPO|nr:unnamed protein product [Clonostachys byssicola]